NGDSLLQESARSTTGSVETLSGSELRFLRRLARGLRIGRTRERSQMSAIKRQRKRIRISPCGSRNASRSCLRRSTKRLIEWTSNYMGSVNDAKRSFLTNGSRLGQ